MFKIPVDTEAIEKELAESKRETQSHYRNPVPVIIILSILSLVSFAIFFPPGLPELKAVIEWNREPFQFYQGNAVVQQANSNTIVLELNNGEYIEADKSILDHLDIPMITRGEIRESIIVFEDIPFYYTVNAYAFGWKIPDRGVVDTHICVAMATETPDSQLVSYILSTHIFAVCIASIMCIGPGLFTILYSRHIWKKHNELYRNPYARR